MWFYYFLPNVLFTIICVPLVYQHFMNDFQSRTWLKMQIQSEISCCSNGPLLSSTKMGRNSFIVILSKLLLFSPKVSPIVNTYFRILSYLGFDRWCQYHLFEKHIWIQTGSYVKYLSLSFIRPVKSYLP